jgi:hypothetical protein
MWHLIQVPPGSLATLSDPAAVKPTFVVDKAGTYVAQLIVNDGTLDSAPDTVTITTQNSRPVANDGRDQAVFVHDTVTLNGSKSSDVDGDTLTYRWAFLSQPPVSTTVLSNPGLVNPTFVVDRPGTYVVQLIVNDGLLDSLPATVTVTTQNSRPVANAGPDQTVRVGDVVHLDGSASYDADGDLLTYRWSLSATPPGSMAVLSDPIAVNPAFGVDRPDTYVAQLIVNDGTVDSLPATVRITTGNSKPVANAGPDQTVFVTNPVHLDGSASRDADGDTLTYRWSLTSLPPGSTATLSNPNAVQPSFVVDRPGTYVAQLIVNDGTVDSTPDTVTITTANRPPVLAPIANRTVVLGTTLTLQLVATDPDEDTLTFAVHPLPANASLNATTGVFTFTPADTQVGGRAVSHLHCQRREPDRRQDLHHHGRASDIHMPSTDDCLADANERTGRDRSDHHGDESRLWYDTITGFQWRPGHHHLPLFHRRQNLHPAWRGRWALYVHHRGRDGDRSARAGI